MLISERATTTAEAVGICPACGERNPSRARYCMQCGARMAAESGERRTVTVLFADLSGFTAFSETVDPEAVQAVANAAASRFGEIVVRNGGVVDKVIGDCVMATFGTPVASVDDAERAVRAAIAMQEEVLANAARFAGLTLSIGVTSGEALYAPVGPSGDYTVLGETVNDAARLQSAAGRGEILIGETTRVAVQHAIAMEPAPSITGGGSTIAAWRVLGLVGASARRPRAPLAGREFDLDRLTELWERATTEQRAYTLTIVGPAGIGKRRLIGAFAERFGDSAQILTGACLPYGDGMTYWPVTEWLRTAASIAHDDPAAVVSSKLGVLLESLGIDALDELRTMAVALAHLVAAPATPRGTFDARQLSRGELHWGISRVLEALSMQRPLVLVIHDAHAAEPALLELVASMSSGERDARILVVVTARDAIAGRQTPLVAPGGRRRLMHLGPLDQDAAASVLTELAGPAATDEIAAVAGGVPLFIEEAVLLRRHAPQADIPSDIHALVRARLALLEPQVQATIARAAVMGEVFWEGALTSLVGPEAARAGIDAGISHALIRRAATSSIVGEREFVFEHALILEAARGSLSAHASSEAHRAFAGWIRSLPDADEEYPELLAYHLGQACSLGVPGDELVTLAVDALAAAARRADAHEASEEAVRFRRQALVLVGNRDPARSLGLALALGKAHEADLERMIREAERMHRVDLASIARVRSAVIARDEGDIGRARRLLDRARDDAEGAQAVEVLLASAALALRFEGDHAAAERDVVAAIARASEHDGAELLLEAEALAGDVAFHGLDLARAQHHLERAMSLARTRGSVRWETVAGSMLATIHDYRGQTDTALARAERTLELLERAPDRALRVQTLRLLGIIWLSRGDGTEAERWLQRAAADADALDSHAAVDIDRYLTAALCWMGRTRAAARTAARARAAADPAHGPSVAAAALAEAYVATATGDETGARARFDEAVASIETHGFALDIADVHLMHGRTLALFGDETGAHDALGRAHQIYERAGADARLAEVEAILGRA